MPSFGASAPFNIVFGIVFGVLPAFTKPDFVDLAAELEYGMVDKVKENAMKATIETFLDAQIINWTFVE